MEQTQYVPKLCLGDIIILSLW